MKSCKRFITRKCWPVPTGLTTWSPSAFPRPTPPQPHLTPSCMHSPGLLPGCRWHLSGGALPACSLCRGGAEVSQEQAEGLSVILEGREMLSRHLGVRTVILCGHRARCPCTPLFLGHPSDLHFPEGCCPDSSGPLHDMATPNRPQPCRSQSSPACSLQAVPESEQLADTENTHAHQGAPWQRAQGWWWGL